MKRYVTSRLAPMAALVLALVLALALTFIPSGCGSASREQRDFYTSGDPAADQRAEQRMARDSRLKDRADGAGAAVGPDAAEQLTLYERLGGQKGVERIVDDFIDRALADPRVNWKREGVPAGGLVVPVGSVEWQDTPENIQTLKRHMTQFIALATGGPTTYRGRPLAEVHENMRITNAQFDATVGDLKATLDKLDIPDQEQKELLAIIETTRPQIAEER